MNGMLRRGEVWEVLCSSMDSGLSGTLTLRRKVGKVFCCLLPESSWVRGGELGVSLEDGSDETTLISSSIINKSSISDILKKKAQQSPSMIRTLGMYLIQQIMKQMFKKLVVLVLDLYDFVISRLLFLFD